MKQFSIKKRLISFVFAKRGIVQMISNEHNAWIHLIITTLVIICGFIFRLEKVEWILIIFAIGLVLMAEGFNTAIEYLCNAVTENKNEQIRNAKDVAAGAVLIAALTAAIIGLVVFVPYGLQILR